MKLFVTAGFFGKLFFAPKTWEIGQRVDQKEGFLDLKQEKFCH